ncbi:hypothetical protein JTE90_019814 [Oedothorax gibbosus]|uniref:Uncharacterized protein n=1 Tax=Oedothorax gibbosus TaxID=931172 RepID=A0AAV6V5B4_9ARAC|nr:hypothetical protein JTE90_019814 [Oedothorax gibbosus]
MVHKSSPSIWATHMYPIPPLLFGDQHRDPLFGEFSGGCTRQNMIPLCKQLPATKLNREASTDMVDVSKPDDRFSSVATVPACGIPPL